MKVFNQRQLQEWDRQTLTDYNITQHELIEDAGELLAHEIIPIVGDLNRTVHIYCGQGHNGADGLVIARLINNLVEDLTVWLIQHKTNSSKDFNKVLQLSNDQGVKINDICAVEDLMSHETNDVIIDALLGTGITRGLEGLMAEVVNHLNNQDCHSKIAIDYPTGLHPDKVWSHPAFEADITLCIGSKRLSGFFQENQHFIGHEVLVPLELSLFYYESTLASNYLIDLLDEDLHPLPLDVHSYKNSFGHVLFIGGSRGKMGAAMLAAEASLRAGCGLVTAHVPTCGVDVLQTALPEAMVSVDEHETMISALPALAPYQAVCIGCGMGSEVDKQIMEDLLRVPNIYKVIDADGLNLIAQFPYLLKLLDETCVLTPHVGEFTRLFGRSNNSYERYVNLLEKAQSLGCFIILKGHHTMIASPEGVCYFNSTGDVSLATAGSGDILAGYLSGMLAQGYPMVKACQHAVFNHGLAGDILVKTHGFRGAIARDILIELSHIEKERDRMLDRMLGRSQEDDGQDNDPLGLDFLENPN